MFRAALAAFAVSACAGLLIMPVVSGLREQLQDRYDTEAFPVYEAARQVTREYYDVALLLFAACFVLVFLISALAIAARVEHAVRNVVSRDLGVAASGALLGQLPICLLLSLTRSYSGETLLESGLLASVGAAVLLSRRLGRVAWVAACVGAGALTLGVAREAFLIAPAVILVAAMFLAGAACALTHWRRRRSG